MPLPGKVKCDVRQIVEINRKKGKRMKKRDHLLM